MHFKHPLIPLLLILPIFMGALDTPGELQYDLDQVSAKIGVLSLHAPATEATAALSTDGLVFKVRGARGVFKDVSVSNVHNQGLVRSVDQLRGARGVELVVTFKVPVTVDSHSSDTVVRYVFMAGESRILRQEPAITNDADKEKIAELRDLVRKLSLEVVEVRKKLVKCEEQKK